MMEAGHDYFYVKGDVKRRFTYLGKKSAYPLAPFDFVLWADNNERKSVCCGRWRAKGVQIKPVVNAGVELHRRTNGKIS
jgi:hypothetical protein